MDRAEEPHQGAVASTPSYRAAIRAFGDVALGLVEAKDLDSLLHLIARHICDLSKVRRCSVYLLDENTGFFRGQVGHADSDIDARVKRLTAGVAADRFTREIVETKQPVLVSNALDDPRPIRSTMREWNIRAMLGVPMVLKGEVIGIVFLDNEDQPHSFTKAVREIASTFADLAAVAIAQAQMTVKMRQTLRTVARQNDLLRRAATLDDRFAELMLRGANLHEIADAVADLTGRPTAVYDAGYQRRAVAVPARLGDEVVPRLLEAPHRDHPVVEEALSALDVSRPSVVGPLPDAGLHHRFLVAPVSVREHLWGYVMVMEYGGRFGALDMHVARRAATNVALELSAERRAATAEWDARASLASELLRGTQDEDALQRRADFLGVDLTACHVVCLISGDEQHRCALPRPRDVATVLAEATGSHDVLATGVAEGVVGMVRLPVEGDAPLAAVARLKSGVADALATLQRDGRLVASVSSPCSAVGEFPRAYDEARQVMRCQHSFAGPASAPVLAAADLGAGRLFLASADRTEAERFAHDTLGRLLGEGDGCADLMATLRAYFAESYSVRRSAAALGVHENTIRYRLARIQELTGLNVAGHSDDQLTAQLALLVLQLSGRVAAGKEPFA